MKILLSAYSCIPGRGSEPGNGWSWASELSSAGHEVVLLTTPAGLPEIEQRRKDLPGLSVVYVEAPKPRQRAHPKLGMYLRYREWQRAALSTVHRNKIQADITHHATWGSLRLGSELVRLPWPLVYGPVGGGQVAPRVGARYFGNAWSEELVRTALTSTVLGAYPPARRTLKGAALVLAQNQDTARVARDVGAREVRLMLADGLQTAWLRRRTEPMPRTPIILWIGRFYAHKAPLLAVEAFARLRRMTTARLIMAGDGPLRGKAIQQAERLGVGDDVDFCGHVPWNDLPRLYDSSSLMLFTSLRDAFGAQVLEALGRGLPVVAFDHHGVGDMTTSDAVYKVQLPTDPSRLATSLFVGMLRILAAEEWSRRTVAAHDWAAQQTWPSKVRQFNNIIDAI